MGNNVSITSLLRTQGLQFVRMLQGALRLFALYSSNHPQARNLIQRAMVPLTNILKETGTLSIGFQFTSVVFNSLPVADPSLSWLAGELVKRRVSFLSFSAGIDESGLARAVSVLATSPDEIENKGGLAAFLRANPLEHARIVPVQAAAEEGSLAVVTSAEEAAAIGKVPRWLLHALQQVKSADGAETAGPEQLQALAATLDPSLTPEQRALLPKLQDLLTDVVRKADASVLSEMLESAGAGAGVAGQQLLESALLRGAMATAARGDLPQAARMLRGLAGLEQKPEKLLEKIPPDATNQAVRRRLEEYLNWFSRPMAERLAALNTSRAAREFHWLLYEIEQACKEGKGPDAADWLLALLAAGGPAAESERAEMLTRAQGLVEQLCAGGPPAKSLQLLDAIALRLRDENCLAAAAPLAASMAKVIQAAAERQDFALATAGAALLGQFAMHVSPRGEAARRAQSGLLKPQTLAQLVAACIDKERDPTVNRSVIPLLKRVGDQAARELLARFENEPVAARRLRIIHLIKMLGRSAAPVLLEKLSDERWYILRDAVALLGEFSDPSLLDHLAPALTHPDERVQKEAVSAVLKTRSLARGPFLARALPSLKPSLLETVLDDLLVLKEPDAVPYLERLVRLPGQGTRPYLLEKAIVVVGAIETDKAVECLLDCASETTLAAPLRKAALRALAVIQTPAGQRALEYFAHTAAEADLAKEAEKLLPVWQCV